MRIDSTLARQDLYERLGVCPAATATEIRAAYRRLARQAHPDRTQNDPDSVARMAQINLAATVLLDAKLRALYDRRRVERSRTVGSARAAAVPAPDPWDCFRESPRADGEWLAPAAAGYVAVDDELSATLAACRSTVSEVLVAIDQWVATTPGSWRTVFMAACVVTSAGLVSWARPTSLFSERDARADAIEANPPP